MKQLIEQCLTLSAKEKNKLIAILQTSMDEDAVAQRARQIIRAANTALGTNIEEKGRDSERVMGRVFAFYQLRKEGVPAGEAAAFVGVHHSTGTFYKGRIEDAQRYPQFYKEELEEFEKFKNILEEYERSDQETTTLREVF